MSLGEYPGIEREDPPGGGRWPNNGEVDERARQQYLHLAEVADAAGTHEVADKWRRAAEEARRRRNRAYNDQQRRLASWRGRRGW